MRVPVSLVRHAKEDLRRLPHHVKGLRKPEAEVIAARVPGETVPEEIAP